MLVESSIEQKNVIEELCNNNNVIVDSVAGSGKTTCNLHIAKHFPDKQLLLLTFSAKLKLETKTKKDKYILSNIEVQTYHSFCLKYYDELTRTDTEIANIVKFNKPRKKSFKYDIIILDEAQDMSNLYFQLVQKLYNDNKNDLVQFVVMGDKKQSIFQFNGADERFIQFADSIFNFNDKPWKQCKLSQSFRITNEMSNFLNNCIFNKAATVVLVIYIY